jgi:HAMP domain
VEGVNDTLVAVIRLLDVAANYVDLISQGEVLPRISDSNSGDFNTNKNNLNTYIEAVNALVADAGGPLEGCRRGKLSTRTEVPRRRPQARRGGERYPRRGSPFQGELPSAPRDVVLPCAAMTANSRAGSAAARGARRITRRIV